MKFVVASLMSLSVFTAQAQVSGLYTCSNNVTTTVSANGKSKKLKAVSSSQVFYSPDGTFQSRTPSSPNVGTGTWTQQGQMLYASPNIDDLAREALLGCQSTGANCLFVGATGSGSAKVSNGDSRFKGTSNVKLTMVVNGVWVNSTGVNKFTCNR